jgi:LmbE family N-acetylglucosaminyl deacetylase
MRKRIVIRKLLQQIYQRRLLALAEPIDTQMLSANAVIFAPHQDDETLACGGTILKKRQAGADVRIVFMADGHSSHGHLMPAEELVRIREREARVAAKRLGVDAAKVHFLSFPDGLLFQSQTAAISQVAGLLEADPPLQVFIPYHADQNWDHVATNRIVQSALHQLGMEVDVYEYPVWWWYHWPWVRLAQKRPRETRQVIKGTLHNQPGWLAFQKFRTIYAIQDVLDQKRAALEAHKSQMTSLLPQNEWLTLSDVSQGDFIACFFQPYEFFYRYRFEARSG